VAWTQHQSGGNGYGLMAGTANLEKDPILPLECYLAVVEAAGEVHQAKGADEKFGVRRLKRYSG
jgi:hypothetical protein